MKTIFAIVIFVVIFNSGTCCLSGLLNLFRPLFYPSTIDVPSAGFRPNTVLGKLQEGVEKENAEMYVPGHNESLQGDDQNEKEDEIEHIFGCIGGFCYGRQYDKERNSSLLFLSIEIGDYKQVFFLSASSQVNEETP